jgi:predicted phage terminase large subunit-like protein
VYTVGIGGSLSGRPVDLLIIDDPIVSTEQADSEAHRERVWDWWQSVGSTRLSPGASVILVQTRWHEDDLTGRVLHSEDAARWRHLSIPAQADHDPTKDQADPLGRQPGEFLLSARGRTVAQWEAIRREKGSRTWNALYQGRPSPAEGGILQRSWFEDHWYDSAQWFESEGVRWVPWGDEVQLVQSWDFAFKATNSSDFVCGQVWLRRGVECWLLDQIHGRLDFVQSMAAIEALSARWPQCQAKFVEEAANGFAVIAALQQKIPGLLAVRPEGSKVARASAVSHLLEAGNVHVPHPQVGAWVTDLIEEAAAFPNGAHDDRVDAMSQALSRLILDPLRPPETFQAEEFDEIDARGYAISPY